MKRSEMIQELVRFSSTIPKEASEYHKYDAILYHLEKIGMLPPAKVTKNNCVYDLVLNVLPFSGEFKENEWDEEEEA